MLGDPRAAGIEERTDEEFEERAQLVSSSEAVAVSLPASSLLLQADLFQHGLK